MESRKRNRTEFALQETQLIAMPQRVTRSYKKKPYTKRAFVKTASSGLPRKYAQPVKKIVERVFHRMVEAKTCRVGSTNNAVTAYTVNPSLLTISMCPYINLAQGTGQGDRIGDAIRTRKAMFNFVLRPANYNAVNNPLPCPQEVQLFIGKVKNSRAQTPVASDYSKLFQNGNSYAAPVGNLSDLCQEVNSDWWTILKRYNFKVGHSIVNGTGGIAGEQYEANNDYKMNVVRQLDITDLMPKSFRFNDATTQPTNDGLFAFFMCSPANGSTLSGVVYPIFCDFFINYQFEDA